MRTGPSHRNLRRNAPVGTSTNDNKTTEIGIIGHGTKVEEVADNASAEATTEALATFHGPGIIVRSKLSLTAAADITSNGDLGASKREEVRDRNSSNSTLVSEEGGVDLRVDLTTREGRTTLRKTGPNVVEAAHSSGADLLGAVARRPAAVGEGVPLEMPKK